MKRLLEFDFIKLFAMFLVLWGNCTQYLLTAEHPVDEPVYRLIYAFHMPLFIMVSGYFASSALMKKVKPFLIGKALQLLLPCLTWGTLFYLILLAISTPEHSYSFFLCHNLWFLKCLFACYVIYYVVFRICKPFYLAVILSVGIALFIPDRHIQSLFPYFMIGVLLQRYYDIFCRYICSITSISMVSFVFLSYFNSTEVYWSHSVFSFILGLAGSLSVISVVHFGKTGFSGSPHFQRIARFGQYTLGVYILQYFILEKLMPMFINLDAYPAKLTNYVIHPLLSLVLLALCIAITQLMYKNRYTALIFFGKR